MDPRGFRDATPPRNLARDIESLGVVVERVSGKLG